MTVIVRIVVQLLVICATLLLGIHGGNDNVYSHTWAVRVPAGELVARQVAAKHGFEFVGQIMPDADYYLLRHRRLSKRSANPHHVVHANLSAESEVHWAEQQVVRRRVKRSVADFNDPKWPRMWYLTREDGLDMGVRKAWNLGMSGKGVVVTILDDGIEKNHPDLQKNYDPDASFDVNSHDSDPQPRYDYTNENRHGTRCAGEVAAEANNNVCSVGIAFDARIGGVRMLDGDVTDAVEATSLSLNPQHIDIYSASWGPDDDGRTVDGPAMMARQAFYDGVNKGRGGLGSIFVWASGNGGRDGDNCNCDGYTNSIYTLSISSATETGGVPWYSEACSSTLAATYSSGAGTERQIVTTDLRKTCTETHTGTSASAPLAAAICALTLQANPQLTWRDMQHLVVRTARPLGLKADDWVTNGVGRKVSHTFGYGLMDAEAMVLRAQNWTTVPPAHRCEVPFKDASKGMMVTGSLTVSVDTDGCRGTGDEVRYVEHVQAVVTIASARRGDLEIYLTSPMGTRSTLLAHRARDTSTEGFTNWAFMTTHCWGESAIGVWTMEIRNGGSAAALKTWSLNIYGTAVSPDQSVPRSAASGTGSDFSSSQQQQENKVCDQRLFFFAGLCRDRCPHGFFATLLPAGGKTRASEDTRSYLSSANVSKATTCERCSEPCATCAGRGVDTCTSCRVGYALMPPIRGACVAEERENFADDSPATAHGASAISFHRTDYMMIFLPLLAVLGVALIVVAVVTVCHSSMGRCRLSRKQTTSRSRISGSGRGATTIVTSVIISAADSRQYFTPPTASNNSNAKSSSPRLQQQCEAEGEPAAAALLHS